MSAAVVQLSIDQGEDWAAQIVWTDATDEPINVVSNCRMDIKDASGATILSLMTPSAPPPDGTVAPITLSTDIGLIQLFIDRNTTAAMPAGDYGYDLFVTVDDGGDYAGTQVNRLMAGIVTVNQRITQFTE